jgi:hypothetical protein
MRYRVLEPHRWMFTWIDGGGHTCEVDLIGPDVHIHIEEVLSLYRVLPAAFPTHLRRRRQSAHHSDSQTTALIGILSR